MNYGRKMGFDTLMGLGANRLLRAATAGLPDGPLFTFRR